MASQTKSKQDTRFANLESRKIACPKCKQAAFGVIESRKTVDSTRRRFECEACGHRETRYEVSASTYTELVELRRKFKELQSLLGVALKETELKDELEVIPCYTCVYLGKYGCSFDYPEAYTEGAFDCVQYKKV
jgi:hypothetical protein